MLSGNPFFHRGPIRDPAYFFGRERELRQILNLLRGGQCISIVGPRRIGKTSLLMHLARPHVQQSHDLEPGSLQMMYVDCESCGMLTPDELFGVFAREIGRSMHGGDTSLGFPDENDSTMSYRQFEDLVRRIGDQGVQLVFLLDEFDTLSENPNLDPNFFSGLRAIFNSLGVVFVTVSTKPLFELGFAETRILSSPFFNVFAQIRLRLFSYDEAETMVRHLSGQSSLPLEQDEIAWLISLAGPHPLLLQMAAYQLFEWRQHGDPSQASECRAVTGERFGTDAEIHWMYFWHTLSTSDRRLLALLPIIWRTDPQGVQRLLNAALVIRNEGEIQVFSSAFKEFLIHQPIPGLFQSPPITLDPQRRIALCRGVLVPLPPAEFELLAYLIANSGQIVSPSQIEQHVWNDSDVVGGERLKSAIKNIRRILNRDAGCIQNVRGAGYLFSGQ
ncbi:AAA family ATPase [Chloroflexales bacterium ZM16-3]|nr:AAA family ATPase [Chloroflexales bacterium ZM16-3]